MANSDCNQENELLDRAKTFDEQALGQVYDTYFERLYRYAYRYVGDVQLAEDIASETLQRFLETLRDGRAPERLGAWLYRVAHNLAMDSYRKRFPGEVVALEADLEQPGEANTEEETESQLEQAQVRAALAQLTPDQQSVIMLKFLEGRSNAEVGAVLNKPEGAVKSLQYRALAALRRVLGERAKVV